MNYVLYLILCSGVTNSCLEPYKYPNNFADSYSCMLGGNNQSIIKLEDIGQDKVNENKFYIKFLCTEEPKVELDT
jgi:hypothetical protein|tara:strand:+ start:448 stop:672 length:225 start_codon:yes stop_codon:yes gene_type:complete